MLSRTHKHHEKTGLILTLNAGENHLSFIETSALDASNVELAFQNILTGKMSPKQNSASRWGWC